MKVRKVEPLPSIYNDYRAVLHVHAEDSGHTKGTREEVLKAAKAALVKVVLFTDHRGPKPETWSGVREGVLFIPGSEDDHQLRFPGSAGELRFLSHTEEVPDKSSEGYQGIEIYNRHTDFDRDKEFLAWREARGGPSPTPANTAPTTPSVVPTTATAERIDRTSGKATKESSRA